MGTVINTSINEVLSRTLITSLTVFIVLVALLFLGGWSSETLRLPSP